MPADVRPSVRQLQCLTAMGEVVDRQLRDVASVFRERDADGVQRIRDQDAVVNAHNRHCFELASKMATANRTAARLLRGDDGPCAGADRRQRD